MKKIFLFFCIWNFIFLAGCANSVNTKDSSTKNLERKLAFINYNEGYSFGNTQNAQVVIVEYSSYECKDCRNLHKNIGTTLKKYVKSGKLLYIYKPVDHPKFQNDEKINKYFAPKSLDDIENIFDKFDLYSKKSYETVKAVLNLKEETVPNYETMNKAIENELTSGNITGTPTIYINGIKYKKVFTEQEFQKLLDSYIK
ncbi:thioredoxin domain-containing protein [Clostridium thailandense]|uniref:thioredoxin domain-containing protein n=1 Tax=Clostridium thailandense TaxID=2794346 RepID=UPI00398A1451